MFPCRRPFCVMRLSDNGSANKKERLYRPLFLYMVNIGVLFQIFIEQFGNLLFTDLSAYDLAILIYKQVLRN